jgi:Methylase involved in ubiquinone/menaquinone biosynthesis
MEPLRKPFQGVRNIVRFNWHFYLLSALLLASLWAGAAHLGQAWRQALMAACAVAVAVMAVSLLVSYYIYDVSGLYRLSWLPARQSGNILNVHAGFDETSALLRAKYPGAALHVCDFYDPDKHTEVSIRRARRAQPPYPNTVSVSTAKLPFADDFFDMSCVIFAAHEIRDDAERAVFFQELKRATQAGGQIYVTEHLRDLPNFLAYTVWFFPFFAPKGMV